MELPGGNYLAHSRTHRADYCSFFQAERSHLFDLLKPSACRGTTFGGRKNIKRWTSDEAKKLVEGVWIFGVGNWTTVKRVYFKTSFRRPVDLKVMILDRLVTDCIHDHIPWLISISTNLQDKWRDFVRACGVKVGSKKEVLFCLTFMWLMLSRLYNTAQ
jgi:hypothetical protein